MTITRVQGNNRSATNTTPFTISLTSTPTSGNVLILCYGSINNGYASISSISQTGVTWAGLSNPQSKSEYAGYYQSEIWFGIVGAGASKDASITLAATPTTYGAVADICEYSGVLTTGFLDKKASTAGTSNVPVTGTTATTTQNDELLIAVTMIGSNRTQAYNVTYGFTTLDGASMNPVGIAFMEKIVSTTGTYQAGTTASASGTWAGCIATFKAAASSTNYTQVATDLTGGLDSVATKYTGKQTIVELAGSTDTISLKNIGKQASTELTGSLDSVAIKYVGKQIIIEYSESQDNITTTYTSGLPLYDPAYFDPAYFDTGVTTQEINELTASLDSISAVIHLAASIQTQAIEEITGALDSVLTKLNMKLATLEQTNSLDSTSTVYEGKQSSTEFSGNLDFIAAKAGFHQVIIDNTENIDTITLTGFFHDDFTEQSSSFDSISAVWHPAIIKKYKISITQTPRHPTITAPSPHIEAKSNRAQATATLHSHIEAKTFKPKILSEDP